LVPTNNSRACRRSVLAANTKSQRSVALIPLAAWELEPHWIAVPRKPTMLPTFVAERKRRPTYCHGIPASPTRQERTIERNKPFWMTWFLKTWLFFLEIHFSWQVHTVRTLIDESYSKSVWATQHHSERRVTQTLRGVY